MIKEEKLIIYIFIVFVKSTRNKFYKYENKVQSKNKLVNDISNLPLSYIIYHTFTVYTYITQYIHIYINICISKYCTCVMDSNFFGVFIAEMQHKTQNM